MPKVIITARVEDVAKWEAGFRTHGDLFRRQTVSRPIGIGVGEGSEVALCLEPDDLTTFMKILDSPATAEAMAFDGVKRETVRVFVLDREFKL
jgi:hypothetical protein